MDYSLLGFNNTSINLNADLISKLKQTETKNMVQPLELRLENLKKENSFINSLKNDFSGLKDILKDLNLSSENNLFNKKAATIDGDSVSFNSTNDAALREEDYNISVSQLAQKDVFQSNKFTNKDFVFSGGSLNINGKEFDLTNKTYSDVAKEISDSDVNVYASVQEVSNGEFRMILKGKETGEANKINIQENGVDLGFSDPNNHTLKAQNLNMNIDGIDYDVNSSKVVLENGLEITANKVGDTKISITNNNSELINTLDSFTNSFNKIMKKIDDSLYSSDLSISNKATLEDLKRSLKDIILQSKDNNSLFSNGFSLDKSGILSFDSKELVTNYNNDKSKLFDLFIGTDQNKGIFSKVNDLLNQENSSNGILSNYSKFLEGQSNNYTLQIDDMNQRLEQKYLDLSEKFNQYNSIITSFEASFSSLKLLINSKQE